MPPVPRGPQRLASFRLGIAILMLNVLASLLARGMMGRGPASRGALVATVIAGAPARARAAVARARGLEAGRRLGARAAEER